jgi:uncharacterized protein (DUF1330 family)
VPAVQSFGGRFLTGPTSQVQSYEAGLPQRTIVVEFESYDVALAAHKSGAYQKALRALGSGAERDYRIVEGGGRSPSTNLAFNLSEREEQSPRVACSPRPKTWGGLMQQASQKKIRVRRRRPEHKRVSRAWREYGDDAG